MSVQSFGSASHFSEQFRHLREGSRPHRLLLLRLGCVWLRRVVIEPIDGRAICPRDQVPIRVDRDLNARVPELLFHVDDGLALLKSRAELADDFAATMVGATIA